MNGEAMQKALRECVALKGTGILTDRSLFKGVIHDMLPGLSFDNERRLLIIAVENLYLGNKVLEALSKKEESERLKQYRFMLNEIIASGIAQEAAETVLRAFAAALGWQVQGLGGSYGGSNAGNASKPQLQPGKCAHLNIDFFANKCGDCGQTLYGIFEEGRYTPYEAMRKNESSGVLIGIAESYGGVFVIPEHIIALDDECLSNHVNLQGVILPYSLRSIGSYAFENCSSLKKLKVPESVSVIGAEAFKGLGRVYYGGPASGSPWGAERIVRPAVLPPTPPPVPQAQPPKPVPAPAPPKPAPSAQQLPSYANKRVGERFEFGRYPQGANGEVKPVTWRVLRRDSDGLLVISDLALDAKAYHKEWTSITWSECTLRRWLNGEFLRKAFTAQEQSKIKTSRLANNAGPATDDRIFLLSIDEAKSLFAGDSDREVKSTAYAIKNGALAGWHNNALWWLRSRYYSSIGCYAASVHPDGSIIDYGRVNSASSAVRPAFKLSIA